MATDPLYDTLFRPTTTPDSQVSGGAGHPYGDPAAGRGTAASQPASRVPGHAAPAPRTAAAPPAATAPIATPPAAAVPTLSTAAASAAPVRETGTRTRAGNAMQRTRAALLTGAHRAVEESGTKITMAQVAAAGGVAKATLYNHFRTREAVLASLLEAEVERLCTLGEQAAADHGVAAGLARVAEELAAHPLTRALARLEPGTLATVARIELDAPVWRAAHDRLEAVLARESRSGAITVLRWLASYLVSPADPASVAADLAVVITGLPDARNGDATSAPATSAQSA